MNSANPCVNWTFTPNPITSCPNCPPIVYTKTRTVTLPPDATDQYPAYDLNQNLSAAHVDSNAGC